MKIGIVTQPLWGNYGGLLQNYALQTVLRRMGHDPVTIDYIWNLHWLRYLMSSMKTAALWFVPGHRRNFAPKYPVRKNHKTDEFVRNYISTTGYVYRYKRSLLRGYSFDAVITGSDQVWRPKYNPELKDMYLDFVRGVNISRIAYAASFGTSEREYNKKNIRECLSAARKLTAVSVREESGIRLCREYFGVDAVHVLDPTLLLSVDDYRELTRDIQISNVKYVGAYILDDNPKIKHVLKVVSHAFKIDSFYQITEKDINISPEEWVAMIRDSEFVVTDSFHGTVFSILFRKPFITILNYSRGADRFQSLLAPLGLMDRMVDSDAFEFEKIVSKEIDWNRVYSQLNKSREFSFDFLRLNLKPNS